MALLRGPIRWEPREGEAAPATGSRKKGRRYDAITMASSFVKRCDFGDRSELMGSGFCFSCRWSSSIAGVRTADKPGTRLHLDTWLLGVEPRWILLGARNVGTCT